MSGAPTTLVPWEEEERLIRETLEALGASPLAAVAQARMLVEADLRERHSHGVQRLPILVERIRKGLIRPAAHGRAEWVAESFLTVDGERGLGPHVADLALVQLRARAAETGVALAAVHDAGHLGMLALYVEKVATEDCLGIVLTTTEALVHPAGGREALVGTNPVAVGIGTDAEPFILDMATGSISMGEILARRARGSEIPAGAALDADGRPTTDAVAAAGGAISPFGGAKGFGLSLAFELLVATLTGTALGPEILGTLDAEHPVSKGDLLIVIDPRAAGITGWRSRIGAHLQLLRESAPAAGSDGVAIPGDRSREAAARARRYGINLPTDLWVELEALRDSCKEAADV